MAYHYVDSGLDNVYLENGYIEHETAYGKAISIQDTEGLHKALGQWLVALPKPLNGAELRFLRLEMEMTQRSLASVFCSEEQNVRRWEKARTKPVPGPVDMLLRVLYSEYVGGDGSVRHMVDRLALLDQIDRAEARVREGCNGWRIAA